MPNVFQAIDPNGVTHTRSSENRIYTHTVVSRFNTAKELQRVQSPAAEKYHASDYKFYGDVIAGKHKRTRYQLRDKTPEESEAYYAMIDADAVANAVKHIGDARNLREFVLAAVAANVAEIERRARETDYFTKYTNGGWCGRYDLAVKLAGKRTRDDFLDVTILEAVQIQCK